MTRRMRTVLLHHQTPDGASHYDWLFAREEPASSNLRTFRTGSRPDQAFPGDLLEVESIGDHRLEYLEYEGAISGDRGSVRRVVAGRYEFCEGSPQWGATDRTLTFQVAWADATKQTWRFVPPATMQNVGFAGADGEV